jgi:hypothetical protein
MYVLYVPIHTGKHMHQGLNDCAEALRRARVDGRVLLTLTYSDEAELKQDLGIGLGERRRLLQYIDSLKEPNKPK